jgi:hypothetical protein
LQQLLVPCVVLRSGCQLETTEQGSAVETGQHNGALHADTYFGIHKSSINEKTLACQWTKMLQDAFRIKNGPWTRIRRTQQRKSPSNDTWSLVNTGLKYVVRVVVITDFRMHK